MEGLGLIRLLLKFRWYVSLVNNGASGAEGQKLWIQA